MKKQEYWTWESYVEKRKEREQWGKDHPVLHALEKLWYFFRYGIDRRCTEMRNSIKYGFQRMFRGYDDPDWWGHNTSNAHRAVRTLQRLRDARMGHPVGILPEGATFEESTAEWDRLLGEMIAGFEAYLAMNEVFIEDENGNFDSVATRREEERLSKIFRRGMRTYSKHYGSLWD